MKNLKNSAKLQKRKNNNLGLYVLLITGIVSIFSCQKEDFKKETKNNFKSINTIENKVEITGISIRLAGPKCAKFGLGCRKPKGDNVDWNDGYEIKEFTGDIIINYDSRIVTFLLNQNNSNQESLFEVEEISINEFLTLNGMSPIVNNFDFKSGVYNVQNLNNKWIVEIPIK